MALAAVVGLAALGCGAAVEGRDDPPIGEVGVLDGHTSQLAIDDGELALEEVVERGRHLFTASFNTLDGAGRPETTDVNQNNFRPPHVFPDNFNRISGPDANSCSSCHGVPRIGGGGDNATNVFVLADRLAFVNFDGSEGDGMKSQTLKTVGNERTSLGLFGSGVIELLAREMTSDLHAIRDQARREASKSGGEVTMELWSLGTDYSLVRVRAPQKEAGTATLMADGNIWIYLPKVERTIKLPASMMGGSWLGSHFTNDDVVKESQLIEDFDIEIAFDGERDGVAVWELLLTPKPEAPVVWGSIEFQVRQADDMPLWAKYYDEDGELSRTMEYSEFAVLGGRLVPAVMHMYPSDKPGERTTLLYEELEFNIDLDPSFFSLRTLQRRR